MAREREGEADTLLVDLVPRPEDPVRSEDIWAVVAVYRESGAVGEGGAAVHNAMLAARSALAQGLPLPEPWGDDSLGALLHLAGLLRLGAPAVAHGCLMFTGVSPHGGPPALPRALLLVDGDCRSEPGAVGRRFSCLVDQGLGGATPRLLPERRAESTALVWQTVRNFGVSGLTWGSQSCFGLQHPAGGAFVMFSTGALRACTEEYCRACSPASIWDCLRIDSGEDSYLINKFGLGAGLQGPPPPALSRDRLHARDVARVLGAASPVEAFAPRQPFRHPPAPQTFELLECFFRGEFLGVGFIVFLFAKISGPPLRQLAESMCNFHGEVLPEDPVELATAGGPLAGPVAARDLGGGPTRLRPAHCPPRRHRGLAALLPASQLTLPVASLAGPPLPAVLGAAARPRRLRRPRQAAARPPRAALALPLALPLACGIENALAPLLGVANAGASAALGRGARQGAGERAARARLEDQGREQRARARRRLLAGWPLANGLLGPLLEALRRHAAVLEGTLVFVAARMVLDMILRPQNEHPMILCSWHSAWLRFSTARGSEAETADDRAALAESESSAHG
ncbi:unnamed protein product, partial [Prorocentrum cordatum]